MKIKLYASVVGSLLLSVLCFSSFSQVTNQNTSQNYTTIQAAINDPLTVDGNTLIVASGTYNEEITVNKQLTIKGANTGVAGTGSRNSESIIDGAGATHAGFIITANNVKIDGFKIQNCGGAYGSGVYSAASSTGVQLLNNIFTGNQIGAYPQGDNVLVKNNLFNANNSNPLASSAGAGIYTERTTNIIIESNEFKGHSLNSAVVFAAVVANAHQNVTFAKNFIHDNNADNSMVYCVAVIGGNFNNNTITQPGTTAIKFAGGCSNIDVSYNMLNNNGTGIKFGDDGYGLGQNTAISAHFNSLSNCTVAAIQNDNSFTANITCNWYGNIAGPTTAPNVGGVGTTLAGTGGKVYANWLNYGTDASPNVGFQLPQNITVIPGGNNSIAINHYRVLSNAIGCLVDNQNLTVSGLFNLGNSTAQIEWAKGNNQIGGEGQAIISGTGDDYSITVPQNVNGVTITASSLGSGIIQGPGDVAAVALENPLYFNDNAASSSFKNWTISNLVLDGFDVSIACDLNGGNVSAFDNLKVINNRFNVPADLNATTGMETSNFQNIGLLLCFGANQEISGNTFNIDGTGASDDGNQKYSTTFGIQSATSGGGVYNGLKIKNNAFHVMGMPDGTAPAVIKGIWENGHNTTANIEVSGNTFVNDNPANTAATNRQLAFWSTSFSSATTQVIYKENEVTGFNKGFASFGGEYSVYPNGADYNAGSTPVVLQNNKFDQNFIAVTARKSGVSTNAGSPVYVAGNSFMNIPTGGFAVSNLSSGATELSCNWHGTATDYASIAASINGAYKITALLSNGTDANTATGFQPSPTATCFLPVHNVTQSTNFFAIQEAIDAAAVGDSIHADGGIYKEVLAINKTLRFGGNAQGVIGTGIRPTLETQLLAPVTTGVLINLSGAVSPLFDGFKLTGNGIANVVQAGQNLTIKNSIAELSFLNGGNNLYFNGEQLNLFNNLFKATSGTNDFGNASHIFVSSKIIAKGNKFTSADATASVTGSTTSLPVWMNITTNTTAALIDSNLFDNIDIGILVADNASNVNITNNEFTNAKRANPTVNGYGTGIALFGNLTPTAPVNIKFNKFYTSQTGIRTSSGDPSNNFPATNLAIAYNSFVGMTEKAIRIGTGYNSSTNKLNAKCNWFNSVTGPVSATNAGANGEPIMDGGAVNYKNWLIYGNDASTALGFQLPTAVPVASGNNTSVAENQYRILSNAVGCAVEGQTLTLNGTFDWANSIAQAEWAKGNDGSSANTDDDYSILVTPNTNNVTVTAASLGSAIIQGPGDLAAANLEGVFYFDGSGSNKKWTLSNLDIRNFDLSIGYFNGAGGTNAYDSFKIVNNHFAIPKDLNTTVAVADVNQNIGIHYSFGKDQEISGNTFDVEGDGVSNGANLSSTVVMQSNTSGGTVYNGLKIQNNIINVLQAQSANPSNILGIWENGHNQDASITVSGNKFISTVAGNNPALNLQKAFRITSKSGSAKQVVYQNNEVYGANIGMQWIDGYTYPSGAMPVQALNNIFDSTYDAVVVSTDGASALINRNSITRTVHYAINNTGMGIVSGNCNWYGTTSANTIATLVNGNVAYTPYLLNGTDTDPATGFQPGSNTCNGTPVVITSAIPTPQVCLGNGSITITYSGGAPLYNLTYTNGTTSTTVSVDTNPYTITNLSAGTYTLTMIDGNGSSTSTSAVITYNPVTNTSINTTYTSIQAAINAANDGDVIEVCKGLYKEDIVVSRSVDLRGPNYNISPNGGSRAQEAIVVPATSAVASGEIFHIAASNVKISGFTIDGNNPDITSNTYGFNGVSQHAAEGVTIYENGINNLSVSKNIFKNLSYFAVSLNGADGNAPATSGHVVSDNLMQDLGNYDNASGLPLWGGGVLLYNNQYATVTGNTMTNVRIGVQTGNFSKANPGTTDYQLISGNTMSVRRRGIFHNLFYSAASGYTLSGNNITAIANANETYWDGILIASQSVASTSTSNIIDGTATIMYTNPTAGIGVWNVAAATPAAITGGSITKVGNGIFINNFDSYPSTGSNASFGGNATLAGTAINNSVTGIRIKDNLNSTHAPVTLSIGTGVAVAGGTTGLVIENGSALVNDLGNLAFTGQSGKYIDLINNPNNLNATAVKFDGVMGSTPAANNFAIEDKINHKIDLVSLGFVLVKAGNDFITPLSFVAPNTTPKIQRGVDAATTGFTVNVAAGTFADNVTIDKEVTINGADTITTKVTSATSNGNIMTVAASNVTISNMHLEGSPDVNGNSATRGIYFNSASNTDTIINVKASLHQVAVLVDNAANISGLVVANSSFGANGNGVGVGVSGKLNGLTISGSSFNSNVYGLSSNADPNGGNDLSMNNVTVTGTKFIGNTLKGMYFEKLSNASFSGNTFTNNGVGLSSGAGLDVNLKYGSYNAVSITGNTFTNNGNTASNGAAIAVKARNDAPNYNTTIATLSGTVGIANNEITTAPVGISLGYNVVRSGVAIDNNIIAGTGVGIVSYSAPANSITNAHNNSIGSTVNTILNGDASPISISANCNWHGSSDPTVVAGKIAGNVTYVPFLSSGADNSPSIGFQPAVPCTNTCTTLTTSITQVNNTCTGGSTGTITASNTAGGVGPYYYTLTNTANNAAAGTQDPMQSGKFTGLPAGTYVLTAFGSNGCSTSFAPVTITQPTGLAPDASISVANFTSNFFSGNGTSVTFLVQVQENAGNPITAATLNLTNQDEYTYSFPSIQQLTIRGITYPIDNNHWTANFNPGGFTSSISLNNPNQVPCARSVYLAVTLTRNTPSKANFVVTSFMNNVAGELNTNNNSTTFLLVGN